MKKMSLYLWVLVGIFSVSCKDMGLFIKAYLPKDEDLLTHEVLSLPEPVLTDSTHKHSAIPITQLAQKKRALSINDVIVFKNSQIPHFKDIMLEVHTNCTLTNTLLKDSIIYVTKKPLTTFIPLIELLPKKVLLANYKNNLVRCRFNFKAMYRHNPQGSSHIFHIESLISNIENKHLIKIKTYLPNTPLLKRKEVTKDFPYILLDKIPFTSIDILKNNFLDKSIDSLKLHCKDVTVSSYKVQGEDQINNIPLSVLFQSVLSNYLFSQNTPLQACRILAYHKNTIIAVSLTFNLLVHPIKAFKVTLKMFFNSVDDWLALKNQYPLVKKHQGVPLYSYLIKNPNPFPIHVLIKGFSKKKSMVHFYKIHYTKNIFYSHMRYPVYWKVNTKNTSLQKVKNYNIITLPAKKTLTLAVLTKKNIYQPCSIPLDYDEHVTWLKGFLLKTPIITMYHLLSPEIKILLKKDNILFKKRIFKKTLAIDSTLKTALNKIGALHIMYSDTDRACKKTPYGYDKNYPKKNKTYGNNTHPVLQIKPHGEYDWLINVGADWLRHTNNIIGDIIYPP